MSAPLYNLASSALEPQALLRIEDVARVLAVGRTTVYALIESGHLKPVHIGRACRIPRREIIRYLESLTGDS